MASGTPTDIDAPPAPPPELAPGELLSADVLSRWLGHCGNDARVFRGCRLVEAQRIRIGSYSQIDEGVYIFGGEGVTIGRHVHMAFGSSISGGGACMIHDFAGIGASVRLLTGTDRADGTGLTNPTIPASLRAVHRGRVEIGAHAIVFTSSVVFPDVVIGEGAVVAAGSLVHHDLKPWGIYAGHPLVQVGVRPKSAILDAAESLLAGESGGAG